MIEGVSNGYKKELEINGIGYRAEVKGNALVMKIGFSHDVIMESPEGITVEVNGNKVTVSGADKQKVGQFAAEIREKRPPEPYKGKGIKYVDEYIRRKEGKAGKGK
jgi:large subunit ribosomal protein L6